MGVAYATACVCCMRMDASLRCPRSRGRGRRIFKSAIEGSKVARVDFCVKEFARANRRNQVRASAHRGGSDTTTQHSAAWGEVVPVPARSARDLSPSKGGWGRRSVCLGWRSHAAGSRCGRTSGSRLPRRLHRRAMMCAPPHPSARGGLLRNSAPAADFCFYYTIGPPGNGACPYSRGNPYSVAPRAYGPKAPGFWVA